MGIFFGVEWWFIGDFMGFIVDCMGFIGDLLGLTCDFMEFNGDLMKFSRDFMAIQWYLMGFTQQLWVIIPSNSRREGISWGFHGNRDII